MAIDITKVKLDSLDPALLEDIGFVSKDGLEKMIQGCNEADKHLILINFQLLLKKVQAQILAKKSKKMEPIPKSLWEADFKKRPPTLREFVEDPYFLGSTLLPSEDSEGLFPTWKSILMDDFEWNSYIHNLVITGSLGIGKCWAAGTEFVLYDGTRKAVEDVKDGDLLMGDDSTPRTVVRTTQGEAEAYEIYPVRGEPFTVNGDHILVLKSTTSDEVTEVTVDDFIRWPRERKHSACLYRVPVEWPEQNLPVDPYIFGLWIGDGHSSNTVLTTMDPELESAWCDYGKSLGLTPNFVVSGIGAKAKSIQLSFRDGDGTLRRGKNELRNRLQALGLMTNDQKTKKFIPHVYMTAHSTQRKAMLAGIIDTDGYKVKGQEGTYEVTLSLKNLSDQVRSLAQSLGYYASTRIKVVNSTAYFKTTITGAYDMPVRLPRKMSAKPGDLRNVSNLTGTAYKNDVLRSRFAVIPVGVKRYYGFTLTGNGRCLLRDFTVTHNTYVMVTILLYRLTLCTLLKNPAAFFGLGKGSKIVYNILSVTKQAVNETAFGDARNFMSKSGYFIDECNFDPDSKYSNFRIGLPGEVYLTAGSKGWHVLGRNVLGVALDEGNWRNEADPDTKAYDLYNEVRVRIQNRFMRAGKFLPAISILASSAKDESSFTEVVIKEIEKANDPTHQKVYRNAVYRIKKHVLKLEGKWFKVCYGLKTQEPYVLSGLYDESGKPIASEDVHEDTPTGAATELVPTEYLNEFKRRPRTALQSIAGISTGGSNRFFTSTIDIERCIELAEADGVIDPLRKDSPRQLPLSTEDNMNIWDYLDHNRFLTKIQSRIAPKRHPYAARFAHLDLATVGLAGLSICHMVGNSKVDGVVDKRTGEPFSEYRLIVEYDFILTICAGRTKPISLEKIQNFFLWLIQECGYRFALVTADQFQCLEGSTLVDTDRGLIPISSVAVGDTVMSKSGPNRVTNACVYRNAPTIRITTNKGSVLCGTTNHKIEVAPGYKRWMPMADQVEWVQLQDLKLGDVVSMVRDQIDVDSPNCALIPPGAVSNHSTVCALSKWSYPTHVTPELAEWLGLMWGDEKVGTLALMEQGFVTWLEANGFSKPSVKKKGGYLGDISIPTPIMQSSRAVKAAFLRGLFSAGGCITGKKGYISLTTKHFSIAHQASVMLRTCFGIHTTVVKSYRKGFGKVRLQHIVRVLGSRRKFAESIGFCYVSKQEKLAKFIDVEGRNLVERVAKIEYGTNDVYDIEVENDPSYTANGFISHNSVMPLQMLQSRGIPTETLSIDRDRKVYTAWRQAFQELRLRMYRQDMLIHEAENLVDSESQTKIDHPKLGTKDTSDSAAGAYYNAVESDEKLSINSDGSPLILGNKAMTSGEDGRPPIEINLPMGYTKIRSFS